MSMFATKAGHGVRASWPAAYVEDECLMMI